MSIKAKQVAGVTTLVVVVVMVLSAFHLATLARMSLQETASRGELLAHAIFQRALGVVVEGVTDPYAALRADGGIRSLLESSIGYSPNVTYAAIVDPNGVAVAHSFRSEEGKQLAEREDLKPIAESGPVALLQAVFSERTFEVRQPVLFGDQQGSIRIGVSTLLVRSELQDAMNRAAQSLLAALLISTLVAMVLAQWMLRPIHVIQSGLSRLGRGELDVRLDLPEEEFKDLGSSFAKVSEQLASLGKTDAGNTAAQPPTDLESVMENLQDGVALFAPSGELIFCNPAMRAISPGDIKSFPAVHPVRHIVEQTLAGHKAQGPVAATFESDNETTERLLLTHAIVDQHGRFIGAMLVARNLAYLGQVHTMLKYSRKLAALGRLMAGVAHEVKNPLNAMTIHLELLKQKLAKVQEPVAIGLGVMPAPHPDPTKHVTVIADEIRRLDQVLNGFLRFSRPEELKLEPVHLRSLISDVATTVAPEAQQRGVTIKTECTDDLPQINADPGMLRQALLNLAINGCQAMPDGGTLRISCRAASRRRVEIDVEDTGIGIPPEHLGKIFDLYFTTKEKGTGIGLSMVYRIVQLHDGEVEVQSTPGRGTRFRLIFSGA